MWAGSEEAKILLRTATWRKLRERRDYLGVRLFDMGPGITEDEREELESLDRLCLAIVDVAYPKRYLTNP